MDIETRKVLEFVRDHFALGETRLYEHISATFRWLMATLFVANGGAIVALVSGEAHLPGKYFAAGWFAIGVVFTFLMGITSTISAFRAANAIGLMRMQVEQGLIENRDVSAEIAKFAETQKLSWKTWIPSYLGVVSLGFFIAGVSTIAGSLIRAGS